MVDAFARSGGTEAAAGMPRTAPLETFLVGGADAAEAYRALCRSAVFAPAQNPLWAEAWSTCAARDVLVALAGRSGSPQYGLALEVTRQGPFRIARFMGGSHANGNFPAASPAFLSAATKGDLGRLFAAIRRARPDIDMLALERQACSLAGHANPLLLLPHAESPNLALAVDLDGGFEALLRRASGKRKCKKHRSQIRKFEAAGGYRLRRASSTAEVGEFLDAFFEMKRVRFGKMGIADVFADTSVRAFFKALFAAGLDAADPPFFLQALEVGGTLRAVAGMSRSGDRLVCEFGAIAEDELAAASPGDFLFFEMIRSACAGGFRLFDFSVGDETYKRLWCDVETRHFDVIVPLAARGRLAAALWRGKGRAKRFVKNNPALWRLAKGLRRHARAATGAREEPG